MIEKLSNFEFFTGYKIKNKIDKGSRGEVYGATKEGKKYAIKIQELLTPDEKKKFGKRAPKIAKSGVLHEKYGVIIMDRIDQTLDEYLRKKRTPHQLKKVFKQLTKALVFGNEPTNARRRDLEKYCAA